MRFLKIHYSPKKYIIPPKKYIIPPKKYIIPPKKYIIPPKKYIIIQAIPYFIKVFKSLKICKDM